LQECLVVARFPRPSWRASSSSPAASKDGGLTPGQLAWVLSQITIAEQAVLRGGVTPVELREYLSRLIDALARLAHP